MNALLEDNHALLDLYRSPQVSRMNPELAVSEVQIHQTSMGEP